MKGKLTTATAIPDNLTAGGYGPKKTPARVARPAKAQATKVAGQPQSGDPVPPAAPAASVATVTPVASVTTVEKPVGVPIGRL